MACRKQAKTLVIPMEINRIQSKQIKTDYLRCLQRAMFNSAISPVPEILLISRSFLLIAMAVIADGLPGFVVTNGLIGTDDF